MIVSGSYDKTVKLWVISAGFLLKTFEGHLDNVNTVAFSPNGAIIASGSRDKLINLWETSTGNLLKTLKDHQNSVTSVFFSYDGTMLVSGSEDNTIKLWETSTGNLIKTLKDHKNYVNSVAFSPDGMVIVSGSEDSTIKLWDKSNEKPLKTLRSHQYNVHSVTFAPNGTIFASTSADNTIKLWDISTRKLLKTFATQDYVTSLAFSPEGTLMVSGSFDKTLKLWEIGYLINQENSDFSRFLKNSKINEESNEKLDFFEGDQTKKEAKLITLKQNPEDEIVNSSKNGGFSKINDFSKKQESSQNNKNQLENQNNNSGIITKKKEAHGNSGYEQISKKKTDFDIKSQKFDPVIKEVNDIFKELIIKCEDNALISDKRIKLQDLLSYLSDISRVEKSRFEIYKGKSKEWMDSCENRLRQIMEIEKPPSKDD